MTTLWKVFAVWAALGLLVMPWTVTQALASGHDASRIAMQVSSPLVNGLVAAFFWWLARRRSQRRVV